MRNLTYSQQFFREGNAVVAYCPELDVSSCGANLEQAQSNLCIAIRLFLEEAAKIGTLADILAEAGYDIDQDLLSSPMITTTQNTLSIEGLAV